MKHLLLIVPLLLLGCSGAWEKDPFAGYSEDVRNGEFPDKKQKPTSISKEAVRLDVESFYEFSEGSSTQIKFNYRIFDDRISFESFYISDLEEKLPGAEFNEQTGELTWNPEIGFVSDRVGRSNFARIPLKVIFFGYQGNLKIREERIVDIHIFRSEGESVSIVSITPEKSEVVEGETINVEVIVRDLDSPTVLGYAPSLEFTPFKSSDSDLLKTQYQVDNPIAVQGTTHDWKYNLKFDLSQKNIGDYGTTLYGIVAARNAFGKRSKSETFNVKAINKVKVAPGISWRTTRDTYFEVGMKNILRFSVFDKEEERKIQVQFDSGCEGEGILCLCVADGSYASLCTITWKPAVSESRLFSFTTTVSSRSNSENHTSTVSRRIYAR